MMMQRSGLPWLEPTLKPSDLIFLVDVFYRGAKFMSAAVPATRPGSARRGGVGGDGGAAEEATWDGEAFVAVEKGQAAFADKADVAPPVDFAMDEKDWEVLLRPAPLFATPPRHHTRPHLHAQIVTTTPARSTYQR